MAAKPKQSKPEVEEAESEGASSASRKSSRLRLVIFGCAGLLLLGGIGGGAYWFLSGEKKEEKVVAAAPKPPTFYDLPDVLVNLSSPGNERTQYLKVKVVLELADVALVQQIQPVLPRVIDTFQVFLRELRPTDLEGSAGVYRLKEELTRRVNAAIAPSRINAVLFKEMIVQ